MMAGQTINDRLLAARHSIAGQGLAKSVCKATTEEMIGPKKKHLDCKWFMIANYWSVTMWINCLRNYGLKSNSCDCKQLFAKYEYITATNTFYFQFRIIRQPYCFL